MRIEYVTLPATKATVEIEVGDGDDVYTITRSGGEKPSTSQYAWVEGFSSGMRAMISLLRSKDAILEMDCGVRIPLCNITKISKIEVVDTKQKWRITYPSWWCIMTDNRYEKVWDE